MAPSRTCRVLVLVACSFLALRSGRVFVSGPQDSGRRQLLAAGLVSLAAPGPAHAKEVTAIFKVQLNGNKGGEGEVVVKLHPEWAPNGVKRFKDLIKWGEMKDTHVYHVNEKEVHFGLPDTPSLPIVPVKPDTFSQINVRGTLAFRGDSIQMSHSPLGGRTNELFFNTDTNPREDRRGAIPIGEVVKGMEYIDQVYAGYQEMPDRRKILKDGAKYLDPHFPKLSKIKSVTLEA